jgi:hypothetical protein
MNKLTETFLSAPGGVFTVVDVANAIDGSDHSRNGLIKRAIADGEILVIRRGLYCLAPRYQREPVDDFALSQRVYGPSYVSLESALSLHGWIPEGVFTCTCVSLHRSREFDTPLGRFSFSRVPQNVLFCQVLRQRGSYGDVSLVATPVKALADLTYLRPGAWTGIQSAADSLRIEFSDFESVTSNELEVLIDNYTDTRVRRFLTDWKSVVKT